MSGAHIEGDAARGSRSGRACGDENVAGITRKRLTGGQGHLATCSGGATVHSYKGDSSADGLPRIATLEADATTGVVKPVRWLMTRLQIDVATRAAGTAADGHSDVAAALRG